MDVPQQRDHDHPPLKNKQKLPRPPYKAVYRRTSNTNTTVYPCMKAQERAIGNDNHSYVKQELHESAFEDRAEVELLRLVFRRRHGVTRPEPVFYATTERILTIAGESVVSIMHQDENLHTKVRRSIYIGDLQHAIGCFFGIESYLARTPTSLDVIFYGIADRACAAAKAFMMIYNLMMELARRFSGTSAKNSYCLGVCQELIRTAEREQMMYAPVRQQAEHFAGTGTLRGSTWNEPQQDMLAGQPTSIRPCMSRGSTYAVQYGADHQGEVHVKQECNDGQSAKASSVEAIQSGVEAMSLIYKAVNPESKDGIKDCVLGNTDHATRDANGPLPSAAESSRANMASRAERSRWTPNGIGKAFLRKNNRRIHKLRQRQLRRVCQNIYDEGARDIRKLDILQLDI